MQYERQLDYGHEYDRQQTTNENEIHGCRALFPSSFCRLCHLLSDLIHSRLKQTFKCRTRERQKSSYQHGGH